MFYYPHFIFSAKFTREKKLEMQQVVINAYILTGRTSSLFLFDMHVFVVAVVVTASTSEQQEDESDVFEKRETLLWCPTRKLT